MCGSIGTPCVGALATKGACWTRAEPVDHAIFVEVVTAWQTDYRQRTAAGSPRLSEAVGFRESSQALGKWSVYTPSSFRTKFGSPMALSFKTAGLSDWRRFWEMTAK
ncbi:unnamed protein product [Peronospora belbahrii]|uniref:Uncharacterized protein n=1 Tax=Peronospora belbahrii TaxID=622444 RepID=A0ABN8CVY9_9STRA|nr:unnamed protein product [Peronospora belbahrii]